MASAEGRSVPSGLGYGKGFPLSSRLGGLGSVKSSPSGVRAEPRPKTDFGVF